MKKYIKRTTAALLAALSLSLFVSCSESGGEEIVVSHENTDSVYEILGFSPLDYIPEGFEVSGYNVIYGIVSETLYKNGEKEAVLRTVSTDYSVTALSGYLDTHLEKVYTSKDGRSFDIETRDSVLAVEWTDSYAGGEYNLSFTLKNGELSEFIGMLEEILSLCGTEASE